MQITHRTLQTWLLMLNGDRKNRGRCIVGSYYSNRTSDLRTTAELLEKLALGNFSLAHRANYSDVLTSHTSGRLRMPQQNLKDTSGISLRESCDGERLCITLVCSHAVWNERDIAATGSHVFRPSGEQININRPSGSLVWRCASLQACRWQYMMMIYLSLTSEDVTDTHRIYFAHPSWQEPLTSFRVQLPTIWLFLDFYINQIPSEITLTEGL